MRQIQNNKKQNIYFPNRISEALNKMLDYPLTIVEAPMGYGKTTAVREHINQMDAILLWQNIYDSSETTFWSCFCSLFDELDHEQGQSLLKLGLPKDSVSMHMALTILESIHLPKKTVIVLDDFYLMSTKEVVSLIEFLVMNEIEYLHIVLISRYFKFLNIEELALKGFLYYVKKECFEFTQKEIVYYYKLCDINLKDKEANQLLAVTEGWISALYLMMLNFKEKGSWLEVVSIYKLVEQVVYEPFSTDIKELLVDLSIFPSFSLAQAIHMCGSNAEKMINEVIHKNALVTYDEKTKNYHMHAIMLDFLKGVAEKQNIHLELYKKAAQWYLKVNAYQMAMHYFFLCEDFENLWRTVRLECGKGIDEEYSKDLLVSYYTQCPEEIKAHNHWVMLFFGFRFFTLGENELFGEVCETFTKNLERDMNLDAHTKRRFMGEYELLMSFTKYNDIVKMAEHHKKMFELLEGSSSWFNSSEIWTFGAPSVLYMFYRESGKLSEAVEVMKKSLPLYQAISSGNAAGGEYIMEAEWYFLRGDLVNAEIIAHKALSISRQKQQSINVICALFVLVRITALRGNYAETLELFNNLRNDHILSKQYLLIYTIEMCEGFLFAFLNQNDKIPVWLANGDFTSNHIMFPVRSMLDIIYGRTLLIRKEYTKLIGSSEMFLEIGSVFPNLLGQIYIYIYVAAANEKIGRYNAAQTALKQAMDIAMPDEILMPFVENCDFIKPLLEKLYHQDIYQSEIKRIFEVYKAYQKAFERITQEFFDTAKPVLTDRENEIAMLAADGLSNREIGKRLFISENTVKSRLKSIFEKFEINSRVLLKQHLKN
jgi:LuxR family maltose regulon positive regulatory protein